MEDKQGSLFENDIITKPIEKVIHRHKNGSKKNTVLVIDDIDGLDPEHIFRILNIFSAHFDEELYEKLGRLNKFGFDKLVLVFDYENLKSLFAAKYGIGADFNGYIDKFFSTEIFFFNNRIGVRQALEKILGKMELSHENRMFFNHFNRNDGDTLETILLESILIGKNSLRNLRRVIGVNIEQEATQLEKKYYNKLRGTSTFVLKLLYYLFGTTNNILDVLGSLKAYNVLLKIDLYFAQIVFIVLANNTLPEFQNGQGDWTKTIEKTHYSFTLSRPNGTPQVDKIEFLDSGIYAPVGGEASFALLEYFFKFLRQKNFFS